MKLLLKDRRGVVLEFWPITMAQAVVIGRWAVVFAYMKGEAFLNEDPIQELSFWLATSKPGVVNCIKALCLAVKRGPASRSFHEYSQVIRGVSPDKTMPQVPHKQSRASRGQTRTRVESKRR